MHLKALVLCCICCLASLSGFAQEATFTQQYANRLYDNPAFAGLNHSWSITAAHRNQWPALNGAFITNQLAGDYRLPDQKSAFSALLQQDKAGIGGLQKLQAALAYAYHTRLTDNWDMAAGLQASITSLRVNYDNLVFGDQLADNGMVAVTSAEANNFSPAHYVSFALGGLAFTDQFWVGVTAANLNKPAYGFGQNTKLPVRLTANVGYKFYARSYETQGRQFELSFSPTVSYLKQQNFSRAAIGLYTIFTPLSLGLVYKGVPLAGKANQDQVLGVIAGLQLEQFKIGFSHDVGLQGFSKQAGGANEISLTFERLNLNNLFRSRLGSKYNRNIVCPAF
ncbi:PorP/SprF family type IX secretion system membrane protein [Pontibacter liquoris]|uniref:PorP/SprF family type IX secretion system membrane protein n=1 Tax=Pontibacter liquoris TaxID=2905677 RepID=UPI001FA73716|nr:PorP/SprF family type IX secretion system membrane protein [Pontibacter liquoris]